MIDIERVRSFWDRRPCNIHHSPRPLGTREYFDEVEARKYFVEPHIPSFAEFRRWRGKEVLEIGCGIGTDTVNFARQGAFVSAIDLSERSLDIARRRAQVYGVADRIRFFHGNAEALTTIIPIEPYDLVYAFGVIHHTPDPEAIVTQLRSYLPVGGTVKIMVYHRYAWKVLWILLRHSRGRIWALEELVARYSEAQEGCPITRVFTRSQIQALMTHAGFRVRESQVQHIFPYRIRDYREYHYVKLAYFRVIPQRVFRWLEHHFGWHLCVTAIR